MGRFRDSSQDDGDEGAIDISPLIDCVFILLIFFIVTTVFVEETGIEVNKPEAAASTNLEKNSLLIAISEKNEIAYGGKQIALNNVQPIVKRTMQREKIPVIIQADKKSNSEILVKVVGEAKLGGAEQVSVSTAH